MIVLVTMLGACANLGNSKQKEATNKTISDAVISDVEDVKSNVTGDSESESELALPKLELTKELLEELIIASLASHN